MTTRTTLCLAGLLLTAAPTFAAPVPAGDAGATFKPTLTVRVQPADQLLADVRYVAGVIARFAPTENEAKEFVAATDQALARTLGPDWRKAIDVGRPVLAYLTLDANFPTSTGAVVVPVNEETEFRKLLAGLVGQVTDENNGTLHFVIPGSRSADGSPLKGFARFAHRHVYLTMNDPSVVALNRIPTPAQVAADDKDAAVAVKVFLDRVPEQFRQKAVAGVQQFKAAIRGEQRPGGMAGLGGMEVLTLAGPFMQLYPLAEPAVRDGQELTLTMRFDRKRLDLVTELRLTGKTGSELSRLVADLKPATSLFAQLAGPDSAAHGLVRATIPEDVRKLLIARIEGGLGQAPAEVPVWGTLVAKLGERLMPTLHDGEIDLGGALRGPFKDDRYGVVAGLRLKDAASVEQALRDAVRGLPKEGQEVIKLDALVDGGMKVHQVKLPPLPEPAKAIFGDSTVHITFRSDAVFAAFGEDSLNALRAAVTAKPQPCAQYLVEASGRKLLPLVTKIDAEAGKKFKTFLADDIDRLPLVELSVEGGSALTVRYGNALASFVPLVFYLGVSAGPAPAGVPVPVQRRAIVPAPPLERPNAAVRP